MKRTHPWQSCLLVVVLAGWALFACGKDDVPVESSGPPGPGLRIREGAAGRVSVSGVLPVRGALVQARSTDSPPRRIPDIAILTDTDGRYAWPLLPGGYELSVSVEGCERADRRVRVEPGRVATADFNLQCETAPGGPPKKRPSSD
jgi:hypothetical protein